MDLLLHLSKAMGRFGDDCGDAEYSRTRTFCTFADELVFREQARADVKKLVGSLVVGTL